MKRLSLLFAFAVVFISANAFTAFAADLKIGVMDTQKIIVQSQKIMKYRAEFTKELEGKRQEYLQKQSTAQALENELKTQGSTMTSDIYQDKSEQLRREARDLKRMQEEIEAEMKAKEADMTRKVLQEIKSVAAEYLKKEKLSIIFEKSTLAASDEAIEITDQVMKLYDSKP
jgi:outer membrane protein